MPIHKKGVKIDLTQETPTEFTVESLQQQLYNVGLTCKHTDVEKLMDYKAEVMSQFPTGKIQTYGIFKHIESQDGSPCFNGAFSQNEANYLGLATSSNGNWTPSGSALGYSTELEYIQFQTHFDFLKQNRSSFTGIFNKPPVSQGKYDTVEGIKALFLSVGTTASATLIGGLDINSIESLLSNAISPLKEENVKDFDQSDSRVIFLIDNYNPQTGEADAIGVLTISWHLTIKNYQEKKQSPKHDTTLEMQARSVLYDDIEVLLADKKYAEAHFKTNAFCLSIPPKPHQLKIFDKLPAAIEDSFNHGLPLISKTDHVDVIILHSPNIEEIGCLDNTDSDVTSTYRKSTTSGFTFSMAQTLSAEFSFEAGCDLVKAGFKIGLSLSFTETWNTSQEETTEYSVPGGKKAFIYQGFLLSSILRYDASSDSYKYVDTARFLTNVFKTSVIPIIEN